MLLMETVKKVTKNQSETNQKLAATHSMQTHFEYFEYHRDNYTGVYVYHTT